MSKDLRKRGWTFVGPTTVYAFMQAMGLVNDHLENCHVRASPLRQRADLTPPMPALSSAGDQRAEAVEVDVAAADQHADALARPAPAFMRRAAAKPRQPVGSTTIFMREAKKRIASTSSASVAVSTSSTSRRMISNVRLPRRLRLRAVGDRLRRVDADDRAAAERLLRVVAGLGLDAVELARRRQRARRQRRAARAGRRRRGRRTARRAGRPPRTAPCAAVPWPAITSAWS